MSRGEQVGPRGRDEEAACAEAEMSEVRPSSKAPGVK